MRLGESPLSTPVPHSLWETPQLPRPHPRCPAAEFHNSPSLRSRPPSSRRRPGTLRLSAKFPLPRAGETARCAAPGGPATLAAPTVLAFVQAPDSGSTPRGCAASPRRAPCLPGTSPRTQDAGVPRPSSPEPPNSPSLEPGSPRAGERLRWCGLVPSCRPSCPALPAGSVALPREGGAALPSPQAPLLVPALPRASPALAPPSGGLPPLLTSRLLVKI